MPTDAENRQQDCMWREAGSQVIDCRQATEARRAVWIFSVLPFEPAAFRNCCCGCCCCGGGCWQAAGHPPHERPRPHLFPPFLTTCRLWLDLACPSRRLAYWGKRHHATRQSAAAWHGHGPRAAAAISRRSIPRRPSIRPAVKGRFCQPPKAAETEGSRSELYESPFQLPVLTIWDPGSGRFLTRCVSPAKRPRTPFPSPPPQGLLFSLLTGRCQPKKRLSCQQ